MASSNVSIGLVIRVVTGLALLSLAILCLLTSILALGGYGKSEHIALYFFGPMVIAMIAGVLAVWICPELTE